VTISAEAFALVNADKLTEGFFIKNLPRGTYIRLHGHNHHYDIVVVNPEGQEVALNSNHPQIPKNKLWLLDGSDAGGSMLKLGFVGIDLQPRLRGLSGGLIHMSAVQKIEPLSNKEEAEAILLEAEKNRPQVMTAEEEAEHNKNFGEIIKKLVREEFPEHEGRIMELMERFGNQDAQMVLSGVFYQAKKYGKIREAFELLEKDWERDWAFQPPFIRGNPEAMPINAHRWDNFFERLGVPRPQDEPQK